LSTEQKRVFMPEPLQVLIVEDSQEDTFLIVRELKHGGFEVIFERVDTAAAMQAALDAKSWDIIVSDYSMPQFGGAQALKLYQRQRSDIPFIVVSGAIGEDRAVEIVKAGAHNYVNKNHLADRLVPAVRQELRAANERRIHKQSQTTAAYLASLVQSSDDAIIGTTLDGTVVSWNSGAERLFGYPASEIVGRSISVLVPAYRPEESDSKSCETVRLRKDRTPVDVLLTMSPINDANGRTIGTSIVAHGIADRKLEENERLALIQELTAALAHTVAGNLETAKRE
jgi:two-component system sensor histidine kinase VicK